MIMLLIAFPVVASGGMDLKQTATEPMFTAEPKIVDSVSYVQAGDSVEVTATMSQRLRDGDFNEGITIRRIDTVDILIEGKRQRAAVTGGSIYCTELCFAGNDTNGEPYSFTFTAPCDSSPKIRIVWREFLGSASNYTYRSVEQEIAIQCEYNLNEV